MRQRFLGTSSLRVSEVGLGTWQHVSTADQDLADRLVRTALDRGITLFDTADSYPGAQPALRHALRGVSREDFVLSTKVFFGPAGGDLSAEHIRASVANSLTELGIDHVDLLSAHRFDERTPIADTIATFGELIAEGKIRHYGVSEWTGEQIEDACRIAAQLSIPPPVADQPQYSVLWREPETSVVPVCLRAGIGLLAFFPLAQGVLTGKYRSGTPAAPGTRGESAGTTMAAFLHDDVLDRVGLFARVARRRGVSAAQLALAWVLDRPAVSAVLVGASAPEQLVDNAGASGVTLDVDTRALIDTIFAGCVYRGPDRSPG